MHEEKQSIYLDWAIKSNKPSWKTDTHIELTKHVTRRQSHQIQILWIPSTHDNPSILGIIDNFVNAIRQLIDSLACVIRVHVFILCSEMSPLKSVDRS